MRYAAAALLALTLASCTSSQRVTFLKVPIDNMSDTVNVAKYESMYGKYDGVYLNREQSIEHAGSSGFGVVNWEFHYVYHWKYLILNPDQSALTTFSLRVSKVADIGNLYIRVSSPGTSVKTYLLKDLVKEATSEYAVTYKLAFPGIVKGSVVDEGYELNYNFKKVRPPLYHDIDLQFSMPCERLSFMYAYPDWWKVKVKSTPVIYDSAYTISSDSVHHKKFISYVREHIPAVEREPYSPYFKEQARSLQLMVTNLTMGEVQYSAAASWNEFASRYKPVLEKGENFLSSKVGNLTDEITAGATSPEAKIDTIVSYLQQHVKAVNDVKDRNFTDVLNDKRGDEYEITGLAHAMLKKAGFSPEYLLIHSATEGTFDPEFYDSYELDIPAVSVSANAKEYFLFPYRKDIAIDQIPEYVQGQAALVISDKADAQRRNVEAGATVQSVIDDHYDVAIADDGTLTVRESQTIRGPLAFYLREQLADVKSEERDHFAKDLLTYADGEVRISSFAVENEKEYKRPLIITTDFTIDNLVTMAGDEVIFRTGGLFAPAALKDRRVESGERKNPIVVHFNERYTKSIRMKFPQEWTVKTDLPPVAIENSFGSLDQKCTKSAGELTVEQDRRLKRSSQPKEKIKELIELVGRESSAALPTLIFARTRP